MRYKPMDGRSSICISGRGRKLAAALFAAAACAFTLITPERVLAAEPWTMENGQYIDASGAPISGALAKGITVTKYQNRANEDGIDWARAAADEAAYVLDVIKNYPVSYPVAYDVESQYLLDNGLTPQQITDNVNAFCKVISDAGYYPIVYANNAWLTEHMDTSQIPYDIWYARYGTVNDYPNRTIWQCTQEGSVDGIECTFNENGVMQ